MEKNFDAIDIRDFGKAENEIQIQLNNLRIFGN